MMHDITWATVGEAKTVTLDYSCDGGTSWQIIEKDLDNDGHPEILVLSGRHARILRPR